jgi:hypothetical protein
VAHHDGVAEIEHAQHGGEIVDQPVEAEGRRQRGRTAEPPLVHGEHAPATRHQLRGQRSEDPEVGAVTVEEHHRPPGAALLGVEGAAVGRGDGVDALGREGEAIGAVGIRRSIEPGEDTVLIDHDAGDDRPSEPSGHQVSPATHVAEVRSAVVRWADSQTLARISRSCWRCRVRRHSPNVRARAASLLGVDGMPFASESAPTEPSVWVSRVEVVTANARQIPRPIIAVRSSRVGADKPSIAPADTRARTSVSKPLRPPRPPARRVVNTIPLSVRAEAGSQ